MKPFYWFLLLSSALLYALPFMVTNYYWWLVFIFPFPLLWVVVHTYKISFFQGYMWGLCAFSLHLSELVIALTARAQGPLYMRIVPGLCIILYQSLFAGLFFAAAQKIITVVKWQQKQLYVIIVWTIFVYELIAFVENYSLAIFGHCQGYAFMNPLLPLTTHPSFLTFLPYLGKQTMTLLLLLLPATFLYWILKKNLYSLCLLIIISSFWLVSWLQPIPKMHKPLWLKTIVALPAVFLYPESVAYLGTITSSLFKKIIEQQPTVELIITPESSFYYDELDNKILTQHWHHKLLGKKIHLILGGFRWHKKQFYNCLHTFYDGTMSHHFEKRHLIPLTEYIPPLLNYRWVTNLYFNAFPQIASNPKERPQLILNKDIRLIPYICSELFFNEYPDDFYPDDPILAVANDRWFRWYIPTLMRCNTQLKAILWQRPIVYISFLHQLFFDAHGNSIALQTYKPQ